MKTIDDVKSFWENNPLFSGESLYEIGSKEFFEEHKRVYLEDVFAKNFTNELFVPTVSVEKNVLDLGCGIGFWTIELLQRGKYQNFYAADLTQRALNLTEKRLSYYHLHAHLSLQNAEKMTFNDAFFSHVNCQGVIHHTPDTNATIKEIARILDHGGTAYISVYYKNFFLKHWNWLCPIGKVLSGLGATLKGRGREGIFAQDDIDEITRLYDGDKNPIGKSYSKKEIIDMVHPFFEVEEVFLNFFPARSLPFAIPLKVHQFLSKHMGFMIHLNLRKK